MQTPRPVSSAPPRTAEDDNLAILATAAKAGDPEAADRLLAGAEPRLTRMALAFGAPPDDVPDLVQEVLIGAWRRLDDFDSTRGSFVAWLAVGLHGRISNLRRGAGRFGSFVDRFRSALGREADRKHRPQDAVDARMTLACLLRDLSPRQRDVVALYELGGLSGKETARILGIGEAAVRSIARDARHALKRAAEAENVTAGSSSAEGRPKRPSTAEPTQSSGGRLIQFVADPTAGHRGRSLRNRS